MLTLANLVLRPIFALMFLYPPDKAFFSGILVSCLSYAKVSLLSSAYIQFDGSLLETPGLLET